MVNLTQTNSDIVSVRGAINSYLDMVGLSRSQLTSETYHYGLSSFCNYLEEEKNIDVDQYPIQNLSEDEVGRFAIYLKIYTPATEMLYLQAVLNFYEFLSAERLSNPNIARIKLLMRQRARKPGQRLPQFPREKIDELIEYAINLAHAPVTEETESLRNLRDRSFILTLADTGLRVHEACNLQRGDLDWNEGKALIIGKGDRQAVVRFSARSMAALRDYLAARAALDGTSGKSLASLPLFARHDRGAGKKIKPMTTTTGRNIVAQRVKDRPAQEHCRYAALCALIRR